MRIFAVILLVLSASFPQIAASQIASNQAQSPYSASGPLADISVILIETGKPDVSLSANWSVLAYVPDHVGRHPVYATISGASPVFGLPEGRYLILAERGGSSARMYLDVSSAEPQTLALVWRP